VNEQGTSLKMQFLMWWMEGTRWRKANRDPELVR